MGIREMLAEEWRHMRELRHLHIRFDPDRCIGSWQCYEVCPIGCWLPNNETRTVEFQNDQACIACGACVLQCPAGAIELAVR